MDIAVAGSSEAAERTASTLTLQASETGLLGLQVACAVHISTAGDMAEMVLADLTGHDQIAELLTLRPNE